MMPGMWSPIPSELMTERILYTAGEARSWILEEVGFPVDKAKGAIIEKTVALSDPQG
jgi:hypothetical protein